MSDIHSGRGKQTKIYIKRCFRLFLNNKGWKIFISVALISLLVCMVTGEEMFVAQDKTRSGAFALVCACFWVGIFNSIRSICGEREIVKREHRTGLHISAYMTAHMIYEAVICLIETVIIFLFVFVSNYDQLMDSPMGFVDFVMLFVTFFLILMSADSMGLMISSIVHSENTAMTVMPFALILQLIMSGMIFELEGITEAISTLTVSRWGLNMVLCTTHFNDLGMLMDKDEYALTLANVCQYWYLLFLYIFIYAAIGIIFLELIDRSER